MDAEINQAECLNCGYLRTYLNQSKRCRTFALKHAQTKGHDVVIFLWGKPVDVLRPDAMMELHTDERLEDGNSEDHPPY